MSNTNYSKTNTPKTDVSNIPSNMPNTNSNTPKTDVLNALKVDDFDDLNLFLAPKNLCWSSNVYALNQIIRPISPPLEIIAIILRETITGREKLEA
uniref:Uncharacterized protein n=1 Tax=Rhizophagus irregularis (strain DAOM 181602 / DAOM 197198 / MUCL 43194) TaxID=747089 RepID=U9TXE2_RHIID